MTVLGKPLSELEAADIALLCQEQQPEGAQFEIKSDLPTRNGKRADYKIMGDYARNALAAEIVAFANSYGGTMVIGIVESSDKPNRATAISALPDCSDLARRLRQSVQDIVDPPLPLLEARGVVYRARRNQRRRYYEGREVAPRAPPIDGEQGSICQAGGRERPHRHA